MGACSILQPTESYLVSGMILYMFRSWCTVWVPTAYSNQQGHVSLVWYYICLGPGVPYGCLQHTPTNRVMSLWYDNMNTENKYSLINSARKEYLEVPVPDSDQTAKVSKDLYFYHWLLSRILFKNFICDKNSTFLIIACIFEKINVLYLFLKIKTS